MVCMEKYKKRIVCKEEQRFHDKIQMPEIWMQWNRDPVRNKEAVQRGESRTGRYPVISCGRIFQ